MVVALSSGMQIRIPAGLPASMHSSCIYPPRTHVSLVIYPIACFGGAWIKQRVDLQKNLCRRAQAYEGGPRIGDALAMASYLYSTSTQVAASTFVGRRSFSVFAAPLDQRRCVLCLSSRASLHSLSQLFRWILSNVARSRCTAPIRSCGSVTRCSPLGHAATEGPAQALFGSAESHAHVRHTATLTTRQWVG